LQNAIDGFKIARITHKEAELIFMTEWNKIENEMKHKLKPNEQIKEEIFLDIAQLYRANSRSIINIDQERAMIS
jgi:hypothetical protein